MAFNAYGAGQNDGQQKQKVDWAGLDKHVVETAGLQREVGVNDCGFLGSWGGGEAAVLHLMDLRIQKKARV